MEPPRGARRRWFESENPAGGFTQHIAMLGEGPPGKTPDANIPRRHHIKNIYATRFLDVQTRKKFRELTMANLQQICSLAIPNASGEGKNGLKILVQLRRCGLIICSKVYTTNMDRP